MNDVLVWHLIVNSVLNQILSHKISGIVVGHFMKIHVKNYVKYQTLSSSQMRLIACLLCNRWISSHNCVIKNMIKDDDKAIVLHCNAYFFSSFQFNDVISEAI